MAVDPKKYIELSTKLDANSTYTDLCEAMGFKLDRIYEGTSKISMKESKPVRQLRLEEEDEKYNMGDAEW